MKDKKEKIIKQNLAETCEELNKICGMNKIVYRAMPSAIDGLKPVERRLLYTLYLQSSGNRFIKMAKAASDTIASFHPHSASSVEDVGAKLTSPIKNNAPVIEGQGNFGSYKEEKAGAARYIECKLSKYGQLCFFKDFKDSNVDMKTAYTGLIDEPEVLPSRYPHALINPQLSGIAYGFASNIPPFNLTEVFSATIKLIKNPKSHVLLIPDSPTGADIVDNGKFEQINEEGTGTFVLQASIDVDELQNTLTIRSIPLQTTIDDIMRQIALNRDTSFSEIEDIKDYTKNKTGVRTILKLHPQANPYKTIEKLYSKNIGLRKTYPVGLKMIDNYKDYDFNIKSFLLEWISFRRETVRSMYNTRFVKRMEEQHMNDIMIFIVNDQNASKTIKLATKAVDRMEFAKSLMNTYNIDSHQANTISNMRVSAFTKEAYKSYLKRAEELKIEIKELEKILEDDSNIDNIIIDQLKEGIKLFGRERQSKVIGMDKKSDVDNSEYLLCISKDRYIKKVSGKNTITGGVGNTNLPYLTMRTTNNDSIFVFDTTGSISRIDVNTIPEMKKKDIGIPLERYFKIDGEIISILELSDNVLRAKKKQYITFLTAKGFSKRTLLSEFSSLNGSMTAIKISSNDELVSVDFTSEDTLNEMVIYTNKGNGIRRNINDIQTSKASARGSSQIKIIHDDNSHEYCIGFNKINPAKKFIFYITSSGRVKITDMKYFPNSKKKDEIMSLIALNKNEELVGIASVDKNDVITVHRKKSEPVVIKVSDLSVSTRISSGEKMVKTPNGDKVISFNINK